VFLLCSHFTHNCRQIVPSPATSARHLPTVVINGKPSKINQEKLTFEIDVGQWVSFGKEKALFPFSGSVPQDARKGNRPFPNPNSPKYLSVVGFLTAAFSENNTKRFAVEIDSMTFLRSAPQTFPKGMWSVLTLLASLTFSIVATTSTPKGKRKAVLDFSGTPNKKAK